jgi:hypothetical protein
MGKTVKKANQKDNGAEPKTAPVRAKKTAAPKAAKTTKSKTAAPAATAVREAAAPAVKTPVAKKTPARKAAAKAADPIKPAAMAISTEDIALRAYFISEKRHREGIHGDSHGDWLEAERQLLAERQAGTKAGRASKAAK